MPRRAWLLPGRRQALVLAGLILVAGASLLLLPDRSRSYRAVATAVPGEGAPSCVQAAPERVGSEALRERVAARARVPLREVAGATEVLPAPAGAVLSVAFEADTAYAAQRAAYTTVAQSVSEACAEQTSDLLLEVSRTGDRLKAAEAALRAATAAPVAGAAPASPSPVLVAARDEAARASRAANEAFDRQFTTPERVTSVGAAEALGSERSTLEDLAVPGGVVLCAVVALVVLRTGWRRAAGPVPA